MGMAVCTNLLCPPKLMRETVFDNIQKNNTELIPENNTVTYIVSMKKDNLIHYKGKCSRRHAQSSKSKFYSWH